MRDAAIAILGQAARAPEGDPLSRDTFVGNSLLQRTSFYVWRAGRPRQKWAEGVWKFGCKIFGKEEIFETELLSRTDKEFRNTVFKIARQA